MSRPKRPRSDDPAAHREFVCESLERLLNLGKKRCSHFELKLKLEALAWYARLHDVPMPPGIIELVPSIKDNPIPAPPASVAPIEQPAPTENLNGSL